MRAWHRHHAPPAGQVFAVGAADEDGTLRAVAIVGRPVARHFDDGTTLEVTRTASDGVRNANSLLYAASWRAAKALGYRRLITYTQDGESGASLRGAGWRLIAARPEPGGTPPPGLGPITATTTSPGSCGRPRKTVRPLHPRRCPSRHGLPPPAHQQVLTSHRRPLVLRERPGRVHRVHR
ncbi:XF1762 family protein [Streptomyces achromogenes]|uniref:XF1762 family protein n=1 Tax=Streptomyces achromogenes TaxID=67255 RepID=UPI0037CD7600